MRLSRVSPARQAGRPVLRHLLATPGSVHGSDRRCNSRPSALERCLRAVPVLDGRGRPGPATRREAGKIGAAIPRGEFGLCDPRRSQITTGNNSA